MRPQSLTLYVPDTRGVVESRYQSGNNKLGPGVFTYSRLPGLPSKQALGAGYADEFVAALAGMSGTCPGATEGCRAVCYAARVVEEYGPVMKAWHTNQRSDVPPIPAECRLLRIHVSGDFDTVVYIENWIQRLNERPDVRAWAYTRSWRVPDLVYPLELLRALPNIQLFASMDASHDDLPPKGWRRAWLDTAPYSDARLTERTDDRLFYAMGDEQNRNQFVINDGVASYVCPEETGHKPNCVECRYCFNGVKNDVTFLLH